MGFGSCPKLRPTTTPYAIGVAAAKDILSNSAMHLIVAAMASTLAAIAVGIIVIIAVDTGIIVIIAVGMSIIAVIVVGTHTIVVTAAGTNIG